MKRAWPPAALCPLGALALFGAAAWATQPQWPHAVTLQWTSNGVRAVPPRSALLEATVIAVALMLLLAALTVIRPDRRRTRLLAPIRALVPTGLVIAYAGLFFGAAFGQVYLAVGLMLGLACALGAVLAGVARGWRTERH